MPDLPTPELALQHLHQQVRQRARPLQQAHQRWWRLLLDHRWSDAQALLNATPALVRTALPLDPPDPRGEPLSMEGDGDSGATGPLPVWLLRGVEWRQTSVDAQAGAVSLLQDWTRLGGSWHLPRGSGVDHHGLLETLGADHAQDTALWLTLLRAGWPARQEGWVLGTVLDNPDGHASTRRLRTALAILDEFPDLLRQRGPDGSTAWHLTMTTLPGLLDDGRQPLAEQLVQRLRGLDATGEESRTANDRGERPVDLCWPDVDGPDPQDQEAHPAFPYWGVLQWLSAQPEPLEEAPLWAAWQRQVELDRPRHQGHPVFQAFAARVEQECLTRLDLPTAPASFSRPRM